MGGMVSFPANGGTTEGYLASPASGKGPGVIVIQEWWGLNDQIKGVADMFAREGFNALAPDFYHGKGAKIGEPDAAGKLMMEMKLDQAAKDARGAAAYLAEHPSTSFARVGVIGFCLGGGLALFTAAEAPDEIAAVVDCYGVGPSVAAAAGRVKVPVLGIFGAKDGGVYPDGVAALEKSLSQAGIAFEKKIYPDAGHAFLNEQRKDTYRPDDAKDAWGWILPFLKQHVR
jgi:carboxymethylenebutenolidase